jgi:serine/threonine-protein kinase HipA
MSLPEINNCPGNLSVGHHTYSSPAKQKMFGGKKVSHILPYLSPRNDENSEQFIENRKRISISGVQEKLSFILEKNHLRLTTEGEQGTYILKPVPRDVKKVYQVPANEHLTMQIAKQVFKIATAENALIFFEDGEPAYITKRFDVKENEEKWRAEDFASLAGKSGDTEGPDYKYQYNYEDLAVLIKQYVPTWRLEMEKYFRLVVFNYLFSNGDAHLKNFGLLETKLGDFILSPAYDLLNTKLHVDDPDFALNGGLFANDFKSKDWKKNGSPSQIDFIEFANRIGIRSNRIETLLKPFIERQDSVKQLIDQSFLASPEKKAYLMYYNQKRNLLNGSKNI